MIKLTRKSYNQLATEQGKYVCSPLDDDIIIYLTENSEARPIYDYMNVIELRLWR
jgi:hypothetical protein